MARRLLRRRSDEFDRTSGCCVSTLDLKRDLVEMQLVPAFVANVCMWIWLDEPIVESGLRAALFLFPILAVADRSVSIRIAIGSWRDGCSEGAPMSSTEPADAAYQL